ncbi:hypothetical protein GCM10020220_036450 [Nonomuraea rubra]
MRPSAQAGRDLQELGDAVGDGVDVGVGQVHALGGEREPVEVPGERERLAVHDLDGLEDAVADHQPVVEHRHGGLSGVDQLPVDPDRDVLFSFLLWMPV